MFNFSAILDIVKAVSKTEIFQSALTLLLQSLGKKLAASANDPAMVQQIADEMVNEAPALAGAVVKGTEAEPLVDPTCIHRPSS